MSALHPHETITATRITTTRESTTQERMAHRRRSQVRTRVIRSAETTSTSPMKCRIAWSSTALTGPWRHDTLACIQKVIELVIRVHVRPPIRVSTRGGVPALWGVTMSLKKIAAGSGYEYLTRQVAAADSTGLGSMSLADYYAAKGEAPGRWSGRAPRHRRSWVRRRRHRRADEERQTGSSASCLWRHPPGWPGHPDGPVRTSSRDGGVPRSHRFA
jgi:hypothetical protein